MIDEPSSRRRSQEESEHGQVMCTMGALTHPTPPRQHLLNASRAAELESETLAHEEWGSRGDRDADPMSFQHRAAPFA